MAEGAPDANGIYQYGEDDKRALFSDLLNLGMSSVSTVVTGIVGRLSNLETKTSHLTDSGNLVVGQVGRPPFTSGWTAVTAGGWAGVAYKKRDGILYINGACNKASWAALDIIFTLPVGFRPARQTRVFAYGSAFHAVDIYVNGEVHVVNAGSGSIVVAGVIPI